MLMLKIVKRYNSSAFVIEAAAPAEKNTLIKRLHRKPTSLTYSHRTLLRPSSSDRKVTPDPGSRQLKLPASHSFQTPLSLRRRCSALLNQRSAVITRFLFHLAAAFETRRAGTQQRRERKTFLFRLAARAQRGLNSAAAAARAPAALTDDRRCFDVDDSWRDRRPFSAKSRREATSVHCDRREDLGTTSGRGQLPGYIHHEKIGHVWPTMWISSFVRSGVLCAPLWP
ncbi:hypothetical protein MRX96_054244 [Rhipicephalus microplus]